MAADCPATTDALAGEKSSARWEKRGGWWQAALRDGPTRTRHQNERDFKAGCAPRDSKYRLRTEETPLRGPLLLCFENATRSTRAARIDSMGADAALFHGGGGTDAGDNILLDGTDGDSANEGDNITMQNQPFLHAGMQRNVIEIRDSGGNLLNSIAGFAPGAI